jgi:transposase InsO family protein
LERIGKLTGMSVAFKIGRRHVKTLMKRMGIEALYRRPRTTKPEPGHKIYPYLLRDLEITRPNQVWAMDISVPQQAGDGPPQPACRSRLQTTVSGAGQKPGS